MKFRLYKRYRDFTNIRCDFTNIGLKEEKYTMVSGKRFLWLSLQ